MKQGRRCPVDGTREKDEHGKCYECQRYLRLVNAGMVVGIDNSTPLVREKVKKKHEGEISQKEVDKIKRKYGFRT